MSSYILLICQYILVVQRVRTNWLPRKLTDKHIDMLFTPGISFWPSWYSLVTHKYILLETQISQKFQNLLLPHSGKMAAPVKSKYFFNRMLGICYSKEVRWEMGNNKKKSLYWSELWLRSNSWKRSKILLFPIFQGASYNYHKPNIP